MRLNELEIMDIVYDTLIMACEDLNIEFKEEMVDQHMKSYKIQHGEVNIDEEVTTKFIFRFSEIVVKWKNS